MTSPMLILKMNFDRKLGGWVVPLLKRLIPKFILLLAIVRGKTRRFVSSLQLIVAVGSFRPNSLSLCQLGRIDNRASFVLLKSSLLYSLLRNKKWLYL